MLTRTAVAASLALSAAASAEVGRLDLMVWNGSAWADTYRAAPGETVHVAMFEHFENAYGFAGCVVALEATGWDAGNDHAVLSGGGLGRQAPWNRGPFESTTYESQGLLRIDALNDQADSVIRGLSFDQANPVFAAEHGLYFSTANPALLYLFDIQLSASNTAERTLVIDVPLRQIKRGVLPVFESSSSSSARSDAALTSDVATITVPAPGALLPLALGAIRRQRR